MRKALIVGVDFYQHVSPLNGCANDAHAVKGILERHGDGSPNFGVQLVVANGESSKIDRKFLKDRVTQLFSEDSDIALFYFSGHGHLESTGGYLLTSECTEGDDGLSMDELLVIANNSNAKNKVIVLDCCHSGATGSPATSDSKALLSEGVTILTASGANQYSLESDGAGVFTSLFVDALSGSAANLVGDITPGSVYAHIDQSLGPWDQRPIFKTNVKRFVSLREVPPPISLEELRRIVELFPEPGYNFPLDPSYEPTEAETTPQNAETFSLLQKYNHINLVRPVDEDHMYYAALNSRSCKLTVLGAHYWRLVKKGRI
ncbi:MAG: caspase family protein [Pseudomonadales bacterium]|nr:caspase family protein [Pseudomonadales bacterium]